MDETEIKIVEDTREELQDFLGTAQEIEALDDEEKQKRLDEIFASNEDQETQQDETPSEDSQNRQNQISERAGSRANSDVALAMQIADKVAADAAPDRPCYVVHGAKLLCSMGSREARLVVPMDHGILLKNHPQITADDSVSLTNVMCFGNCFSSDNPAMEQAAIDATNRYNQEKPQSFWGKVKSFFGVKPKVVDSASRELQALCICECRPCIPADSIWEESNEKSLIKGSKTLIQPAVLVCQYGGVIRIIDNGQDE